MDLDEYKCRLYGFGRVFELIFGVVEGKKTETNCILNTSNIEFRNKTISDIRFMMSTDRLGLLGLRQNVISLDDNKINSIGALKQVNLAADIETLTAQAEAVMKEIIDMGNKYANEIRGLFELTNSSLLITDYIRDLDGNIIEPFSYWTDCVEIYIRKKINKMSNNKIATTYSIMSSSCSTVRSRLHFISCALEECELLEFIVRQNMYPPRVLSGTKQPSLKCHVSLPA